MATRRAKRKTVATFTHDEASRTNIPTAEYQTVMEEDDRSPIQVAYERRNRDLDPQLVWRGKDGQDWSDLVVQAPPLFIQEKVHPKVLIDDLLRRSKEAEEKRAVSEEGFQADLFSDFNGLPSEAAKTEFYQHDANWSNRMILGDSLQVMASLAEREGLRGKVQCIYLDPPYGIKFNSNFQWSTTSRDVKDGKAEHITREPEQVKAFRDTWRDGIHSYLTYLRDRLTVARDLLTESGSIFVQIGDENLHHVRELMDEVFGQRNFVAQIYFSTTGGFASSALSRVGDYLVWYARDRASIKYRQLFQDKPGLETGDDFYKYVELANGSRRPMSREERRGSEPLPNGARIFGYDNLQSSGSASTDTPFEFEGEIFRPNRSSHWKATWPEGMVRLKVARRIGRVGNTLRYVRYIVDNPVSPLNNSWMDTSFAGFATDKKYVVETNPKVIQRCILMTTDPGDLVFDPTCGSGTTAYVAEEWGRRWITIDTSRVALALARARIMGTRYPYYLLSDSRDGQLKEAEVARKVPSDAPTYNDIRQGFVYERVPHITLKSIANNTEIDVIWEEFQGRLEPLRERLNSALSTSWEEWEIPRDAEESWPEEVRKLHAHWWEQRIARQRGIDASIAAKADYEYLYDKPYEDKKTVRVAGPFTVDSLSPHRVLGVDENDELIDHIANPSPKSPSLGPSLAKLDYGEKQDFTEIILEHLKTSGVQQARKEDRISFSAIKPWPGDLICAEGSYLEGDTDTGGDPGPESPSLSPILKRAAIFIGPEFGTVSRPDLGSV